MRKWSNDLFRGQPGDQRRQALAARRVAPVRPDIGQGIEDEGALGHAGMGQQRRLGPGAHQPAIGQQIEIEDPGRVGDGAMPAEVGLDLMQQGEQRLGAERGLDLQPPR